MAFDDSDDGNNMVIETAHDWLQRSLRRKRRRLQRPAEATSPCEAAWSCLRITTTTASATTATGNDNFRRDGSSPMTTFPLWDSLFGMTTTSEAEPSSSSSHYYNPDNNEDEDAENALFHSEDYFSNAQHQLPFVVIRGSGGPAVGKTWTLVSLAARFVVATRASLFQRRRRRHQHQQQQQQHKSNSNTTDPAREDDATVNQDILHEEEDDDDADEGATLDDSQAFQNPVRVIMLDTFHKVIPAKLVYAVRANLLRQLSASTTTSTTASCTTSIGDSSEAKEDDDEISFQKDMTDCLERIHLTWADDVSGWIPILEELRAQLVMEEDDNNNKATRNSANSNGNCGCPTLILWNGFLADMPSSSSSSSFQPGEHDAYSKNNQQHAASSSSSATRTEVIRQLVWLRESCPSVAIVLVSTDPSVYSSTSSLLGKHVTHRARLERSTAFLDENSNTVGHLSSSANNNQFVATTTTVGGGSINASRPFSISASGIV